MRRRITIYQLTGENLKSKLPELARGHEVTAYAFGEMSLNKDDIAVGNLYESKLPIPSFENSPSHVMNLALHIYEKHAFLTSKGYQADLYDIKDGWCSDVHPFDGGFNCPLTNTQIGKFRSCLGPLDNHVWGTEVSFDPRINVKLSGRDEEWLKGTWDLGQSEDGIRAFLESALTSLNDVLTMSKEGYISVYIQKSYSTRTLFEFQQKKSLKNP